MVYTNNLIHITLTSKKGTRKVSIKEGHKCSLIFAIIRLTMLLQVGLFVILLASSGGTPYYITPSDDIIAGNNSCFFEGQSLQPCSTLETVAVEGTFYFNDFGENLTIFFLPGRHIIRNNTDLILKTHQAVILTPFEENGTAILIECKAEVTIFFSFIDMIIIRSFEFHSCGRQDKAEQAVIHVSSDSNLMNILDSSFINGIGSAVTIHSEIVKLTIDRSKFKFIKNATARTCGAICVTSHSMDSQASQFDSKVSISDSVFEDNLVKAIFISGKEGACNKSSKLNVINSVFSNNTSVRGAVIDVVNINFASTSLIHSTFDSNRAVNVTYDGGAIHIHAVINNNRITIADCVFQNNRAAGDGGAIRMFIGGRYHLEITNSIFLANTCDRAGGGISFYFPGRESNQLLKLRNVTFEGNSAQSGGGISAITEYSQVMELENVTFRRNFAANGGAISIEKTALDVLGHSVFTNNGAISAGGALMAYESKLLFKGTFWSLENNSAGRQGGALFLSKSFLTAEEGKVKFVNNEASLGGALYVKDFSDQCIGSPDYFPCFFLYAKYTILYFGNNIADEGPVLYGGFLNNCDLGHGIRKFENSVNISSTFKSPGNSITSDVINTCFCNDKGNLDCSERRRNISAIKGGLISLMVTTIDQYEQFKPSFVSSCDDSTLAFGEGECNHNLSNACQSIKFHVYSRKVSGDVILRSSGPCKEINKLTIKINFLQCPRCFQLAPGKDRCECDRRLGLDVQCQIKNNVTIVKKQGRSWFQYFNDTLQVCKRCPLGYCKNNASFPPLADVNDSQCANNHSGIICGACKVSFSVALGSSRCINCFDNKKYDFLWLVPLFAIMGLILVLNMLFLDLTVSIGLINGLIFYANILSISGLLNTNNSSIHPLLSVFISWVNLDFGIETCFYSGMNTYQKTWLQFAFPLYIWLLVGLIIILSHYSTRVMRLLGRKVIPVLATLFLLSYAKILRIVITSFNFIEVLTGDADNITDKLIPRKVWTQDGNVDYLSGKHIPLFIVALLFLVVLFLPYTLLLTFGQCLRTMSKKRRLRWLRTTTFISIMDAYHAPFNRKHRYWTGLLLLIRCILLIIFITISYDENATTSNIFIILMVNTGLLIFKASIKDRIYKSITANIFEDVHLLNLAALASLVLYFEIIHTSVHYCLTASISVALTMFMITIVCHMYYKIRGTDLFQKFLHKIKTAKKVHTSPVRNIPQEDMRIPSHSTTYVELREALLESAQH